MNTMFNTMKNYTSNIIVNTFFFLQTRMVKSEKEASVYKFDWQTY